MDPAKAEPYWWENARPAPNPSPLPQTADAVIVGGGFAGLSAALSLARLGRSVVVIDSQKLGEGASTRNAGMCSDQLKPGVDELVSRHGELKAGALIREARAALDHLWSFVAEEGIECRITRTGRYRGAFTVAQRDATAREYRKLAKYVPLPFDVIPQSQSREEVGTDAYVGGVLLEHLFTLDPSLYHRGLLDLARRAGATIVDKTQVTKIEPHPGRHGIQTTKGMIFARDVAVATNGYSGSLIPYLQARVVPVLSSMIATAPLPQVTMDSVFPRNRGVIDTNRLLVYYRKSPDGTRILFGGRPDYSNKNSARSGNILAGYMKTLFPQLQSVEITHSWNGYIAYSFDKLPHVGEQNGIHFAAGCCGAGVAMMTWLGHKMALRICGSRDGASAFADIEYPSLALYRGNPWFLPLVQLWYRAADLVGR